ncbi:hypothetical protein [Desulfonatronum parangueonense]
MRQKRSCRECRRLFTPSPRRPDQRYCSREQCQKARKRDWQRERLKTNEKYRANQQASQQAWQAKNPGYWAKYRQEHPEYVQRNREKQRERGARLRIAKMDVLGLERSFESGTYKIIPVHGEIANMDVIFAKIELVSAGCG